MVNHPNRRKANRAKFHEKAAQEAERDIASIEVTITERDVTVVSPYNVAFIAAAKELGGKFNGAARSWQFNVNDERRVREVCRTFYGSDGVVSDTVALRVEWLENWKSDRWNRWKWPVVIHGREIAGRYKLGTDVIKIAGNLGGDTIEKGTVLLVRNFPREAATKMVAEQPDKTGAFHGVRIYSIETETPDKRALLAERERLIGRIAEIDRSGGVFIRTCIDQCGEPSTNP
jgi:hypothetical protein